MVTQENGGGEEDIAPPAEIAMASHRPEFPSVALPVTDRQQESAIPNTSEVGEYGTAAWFYGQPFCTGAGRVGMEAIEEVAVVQ